MFLAAVSMMTDQLCLSIPDIPGTSFHDYSSPCSLHFSCSWQQCPWWQVNFVSPFLIFLTPVSMITAHLVFSIPDVPFSSVQGDSSPCSVHSWCSWQQCPWWQLTLFCPFLMFLAAVSMMTAHLVLSVPDVLGSSVHDDRQLRTRLPALHVVQQVFLWIKQHTSQFATKIQTYLPYVTSTIRELTRWPHNSWAYFVTYDVGKPIIFQTISKKATFLFWISGGLMLIKLMLTSLLLALALAFEESGYNKCSYTVFILLVFKSHKKY